MSLFGNLGGATTSAPATNTLFGGTAGNTTATSLFGTPTTNTAQTGTTATAPATGGLFGANPATTQATPSLFGGTATATAPATGGLFGSTPAATTGTATAQAGTTGGLFGNTGTATDAKPSLFGTGTTTTTTQPATGGLFGNLGTTTANQQPAAGTTGGLFGGLGNTSTTAAKPSLFGAPATSTQQPATMGVPGTASASLFGATNNQAPANNSAPVNQTSGAFFDSLLARNKKLAEGETALGDLPSLQLGLGDLRQRLKKVGPPTQGRPIDGKAHYFLAASGVDPGAAIRDLGAFGLGARAERPQTGYGARDEVDVETYLSNLQQKTTLSMISDGLERSVRDFDSFLEENVTMEWEAQRKRIYQHFGIQPRNEAERASGSAREGGFGRSRRRGSQTPHATQNARSGLQRSIIGTPSRIGSHAPEFSDVEKDAGTSVSTFGSVEDRFLREKQEKLSEQVRYVNDARQHREPVYICRDFADLESRSGDKHAPHIVDAYRAMMEIVGENPHLGQVPRERAFAKKYLDPSTSSKNAVDMRKQILDGANRFLEKQFFDEVNALIAKYPQDANLGGKPDVVSKIKAYIRLRIARKTLVPDNTDLQSVNGEYIWAVVFYLLRAGFVNEAATYVNDMQHHFRSIDRTFPGYINSYASSEDRRLKRQMQDRCTSEYNQRIRNAPEGTIDPFRMACYKIIGRCDVSNRSLDNLNTDVNDWIWLQFNLARESAKELEIAGESYGLPELRASIKEIGLKHFPKSPAEDTNGSFGMFFFMQILAGMFEEAIAYLYPFSYVDAVHFAIALTYYGLLRPADAFTTGNELLSYSTRGLPQINFGRMLGYYTRDFRAANAASAVDYLVLICLNADDAAGNGQAQAQLCHEALRELVLETREFSKLIGDIKPDGHRIPGVIEQRGSLIALGHEQEFVTQITHQAATYADDNGRTTDAVLLYHLAGDYDTVIAIVSRALSEAVSLEIGEDPLRLVPIKPRADGDVANAQQGTSLSLAAIDDPVELAHTMMSMYERDAMFLNHVRDQNRIACNILLKMSEIKEMIQRNEWAQAIDVIRSLEILPTDDCMGDPAKIRSYASKFSSLPQPVAINVPNLLMWTIICCTRQRERLLTGQFVGNTGTAREMLARLKQITVDLTTYTSQLRYRLPPHLIEALARASAD
ncbi:Nup93/Nic96-domain-containing protein [Neurospora hispaniola]|uniref:Nup93/Nic96-domain-containing protein n=1 Tax=Neurospora hispaniola TaxID=588809 RepID=A0AAJ0I682_9PEZI|nr:Nup93/Nic96-domain-containing protein [Neurospora hispaniola]